MNLWLKLLMILIMHQTMTILLMKGKKDIFDKIENY